MRFVKMRAAGIDYVCADCQRCADPERASDRLAASCGEVDGDALVLILPSNKADAKLRLIYADGTEARFCGGAACCVGKYLFDSGQVRTGILSLETAGGLRKVRLTVRNGAVVDTSVDVEAPVLDCEHIPVAGKTGRCVAGPFELDGVTYSVTCVKLAGKPHAVLFCDAVADFALERIARLLGKHDALPEGICTDAVEIVDRNDLRLRTWEKGRGEISASLSGACAAAVAAVLTGTCDVDEPVSVRLTDGETLTVEYMRGGGVVFRTVPETILAEPPERAD